MMSNRSNFGAQSLVMDYAKRLRHCAATVHGVLEEQAQLAPQHLFLIADSEIWTSDRLNRAANRLARGDRLALMMAGSVEYVVAWFAIADAQFVDECSKTPLKNRPIIVNGAAKGSLNFRDVPVQAQSECDLNSNIGVQGTDPAYIIVTFGTTGPSKGVVITHYHEVSFGAVFDEVVEMRADDVSDNYLCVFHIAAMFLTAAQFSKKDFEKADISKAILPESLDDIDMKLGEIVPSHFDCLRTAGSKGA
jgi:crotonobetaine/carnitine-CoA ligase